MGPVIRVFRLARIEEPPNFYTYSVGDVFQTRDGRSVNSSLHEPNEINRVIGLFRQLFLREVRFPAEVGNVLAEQSI